ncbi:DUF2344 domain-containing protein [Clostridium sp. WB02_MRS01]|uniref:hypothetical protein n=1 Tax=Clostridium sp. WB02_MRS01 TaxID=2605777 RepID=UPI0012B3A50C|nr:hypothetical protein [Clostridium sp. WB02_MRS01]MSS07126.1 DUF2344 domain-containing protein [Clostridium sp. WB02_MRS01]
MSISPEIKCDICGKKFKTYGKKELEYFDYEQEEVTRYYPLPEENAHRVKNYLCDDCYNKIGDIVKQKFIEEGDVFCNRLDERKKEALGKYQNQIDVLENENRYISDICNVLRSTENILDIKENIVDALKNNFPYTPCATYYLEDAIEIEKRTKQGKKEISEWIYDLSLEVENIPKPYRRFDLVDKNTFKKLLPDCEIKSKTFKELSEIIDNL